jgi:23S rRNA-/tRNA-specific pseudouridylate synthase
MDADLVRPARLQPDAQQRVLGQQLLHLEVRDRLPVSGDLLYGVKGDLGLERQFLHSARLAFDHPLTGERVETVSPLPSELAEALELARSR